MINDIAQQEREIFAERLNHYMNIRGITQADIVSEFGITASTVSDWCNAKKYPRVDKIQMLADYFGILKSDLTEKKGDVRKTDDPRTSAQILEDSIKNAKGKIVAHGGNGTIYVDDVADAYYRNFPEEAPKDKYLLVGDKEAIDITKEEFEKLKSLLYTIIRG